MVAAMSMLDTLSGSPLAQAGLDLGGATQFVFFQVINDFLRDEIDIFQWSLLQRTTLWVGSLALIFLTLWIMIQGYRIVTGQSREPMMALVGNSLKAVLIIGLATSMAGGSSQLYWAMTDGTANQVSTLVTGKSSSPFQSIDKNLAYMQLTLTTIDSLSGGQGSAQDDAKSRAMWFTGIGLAGPGVIAGSMLLLNKIAIALFVGLGPLFILALLFPQTKSLFSKWLLYGIGTMFSLGVLSFTATLSLKMVQAVAASFLVRYAAADFLNLGNEMNGINSMALQQGGLGLVLSILIVSAPPVAATFFQGTLAAFSSYSSFGNVGSQTAQRPPGVPGIDHKPGPNPQTPNTNGDNQSGHTFANHSARTPSNISSTGEDSVKRTRLG
jgi:type IV secretion system protein VirB6